MTIGFFIDDFIPDEAGNTASSIMLLKTMLESEGHEVYIITSGFDQNEITFEDHLMRIPRKFRKRNSRYYNNNFFSLSACHKLEKINFDVIHIYGEFGIASFGRRFADMRHIPYVYSYGTRVQNDDTSRPGIPMLEMIEDKMTKMVIKSAVMKKTEIIISDKRDKEIFRTYEGPSYINLIPPAYIETPKNIDASEIRTFKERYDLLNKKIIVHLGPLVQAQNVSRLIDDFDDFLRRFQRDDIIFLITGEGPERNALKNRAEYTTNPDSIIFLDEKRPDDFYLQIADALIYDSASDEERIVISSMAHEVPVLVRYNPDLFWYIRDGLNGFTFQSSDEFVLKLYNILNMNHDEMESMNRLTKETIRRYFSKEAFYKKVFHVYEKAIRINF